jgi:putative serine protease PepD
MDSSSSDRRRLTWRDLPATPPIEQRSPAAAPGPETTQLVAPLAAARPTRARRRSVLAAGLVGAVLLVGAGFAAGSAAGGRGIDASAGPQGLFGGSGAPGASPNAGAPSGGSAGPGATRATPAPGTAENGSVADAADQLLPSVVQIETSSGLGSGFVADRDGYILTASHVVGTQTSVTVRLKDGTTVAGDVVAADSTIDTAVVKVAGGDLPPAALGSSTDLRVGETAIAVGSPFGFDQTVTKGIISGLDRTLDTEVGQLTGLIQTDAPINTGNSGGPLADTDARVIGINTAIASQSGGSNGVGFAIPIDTAKALLQKVKDGSWTAADNKPFAGGGLIPGLGTIPGLGDIPDLGQLFGQGGPLSPDGLFGPNGLFGVPDQASPDGSRPNGGQGDETERLFRWLFNNILPELIPGSGSGGS